MGQRVMVHHYKGCTVCEHCRSGWSQLCQEEPVVVYGNNAHGGHARYLKVPAFTLVPLHDELSFSAGAAIACGTGTAYGALRRLTHCRGKLRRGQPDRSLAEQLREGDAQGFALAPLPVLRNLSVPCVKKRNSKLDYDVRSGAVASGRTRRFGNDRLR
jgi:hypothetical protein